MSRGGSHVPFFLLKTSSRRRVHAGFLCHRSYGASADGDCMLGGGVPHPPSSQLRLRLRSRRAQLRYPRRSAADRWGGGSEGMDGGDALPEGGSEAEERAAGSARGRHRLTSVTACSNLCHSTFERSSAPRWTRPLARRRRHQTALHIRPLTSVSGRPICLHSRVRPPPSFGADQQGPTKAAHQPSLRRTLPLPTCLAPAGVSATRFSPLNTSLGTPGGGAVWARGGRKHSILPGVQHWCHRRRA